MILEVPHVVGFRVSRHVAWPRVSHGVLRAFSATELANGVIVAVYRQGPIATWWALGPKWLPAYVLRSQSISSMYAIHILGVLGEDWKNCLLC